MAMTQAQLLEEIKQLSPEDKKALLDEIFQIVREETRPSVPRKLVVEQLRGIAKPDGPIPSDEELKEDYVRYLEEKYS
jgi:hypothetical protein